MPNLETPENLKIAQNALDGFNAVLAKDPNDLTALKQIASIDRNIKKFDEAKDYEKKVIAIAPNDPEAYYTVGFVNWTLAYKNAIAILAADGLTDAGDGNPKKSKGACEKLQAANTGLVTEGIQYLNKAIELNPNYDDAMQYMQLTLRRKADLECGNEAARKEDMAQVDMWDPEGDGRSQGERTREGKEERGWRHDAIRFSHGCAMRPPGFGGPYYLCFFWGRASREDSAFRRALASLQSGSTVDGEEKR